MQSLAQILATFTQQDRAYRFSIDDDWSQGRTVFGGLIAAIGNFSLRQRVPLERPLRALQIVFVGPNAPGSVDFEPSVLRAGKAVTLANCVVRSAGEITATMSAMYGASRESALQVQPHADVSPVLPAQLVDVPLRAGLPGFTQHYQQRWARGGLPFSRASDSAMSVYVRYRHPEEPVRQLTETHALAQMDAIPSPALAMLDAPGPASTVSWTLEILDHQFDFNVDEWWRLDAHVDAATGGYVTHTSHVVNPAGRIAAISRQVVVVYG